MIETSPEKKIGKYVILKRLGRGGMGYVYHAFDPLIKRDVAIKIIHPDMAEDLMLIERFKREAQSAGGPLPRPVHVRHAEFLRKEEPDCGHQGFPKGLP